MEGLPYPKKQTGNFKDVFAHKNSRKTLEVSPCTLIMLMDIIITVNAPDKKE